MLKYLSLPVMAAPLLEGCVNRDPGSDGSATFDKQRTWQQ